MNPTEPFLKRLELLAKRGIYAALRLVFHNRSITQPVDAQHVRKILIFRYDRIGDMIVTMPLVTLLRERLPQAELHILASPRNVGLIRHDKRFAKIFLYDGVTRGLGNILKLYRLTRVLRRERYDCVLPIIFHGQTTLTGIMINLVASSHAIKPMFEYEERKEMYATLYNAHLKGPVGEPPMAELLVRFACELFGWDYAPTLVRYGLALTDDHEARAEAFCTAHKVTQETTLFNISAGKDFCQWSEARNHEFMHLFCAVFPATPVLLNAAPTDRAQAGRLAAAFPQIALMPPTEDILDIAAVMRRVGMVITPDTSIVHLATTFQIPCVVLYSLLSFGGDWLPFPCMPYRTLFTEGELPVETIEPRAVVEAYTALQNEVRNVVV
jgi:ADP-heptose:LPS heptosyltransferase